MEKTNSTFVRPLRWLGTGMLLLAAWVLSMSNVQAQGSGCGCAEVNVTLDAETCQFALTHANLGLGAGCDGLTVRVVDNYPANGNIIDCPGYWTYGLFNGNTLVCWGKVRAEDKSGPLFLEFDTQCDEKTLDVPGDTYIDANGFMHYTEARFLCTNVEQIYNVEATWKDRTHDFFAGAPIFGDACDNETHPSGTLNEITCQCNTTLKATDQIRYLLCDETHRRDRDGYQVWAEIKRTFTATDCYGNTTQGYQIIELVRPSGRELYGEIRDLLSDLEEECADEYQPRCGETDNDAADRRRRDRDCCGEIDYILDLACLVDGDKCTAPSAAAMVDHFKKLLVIDNPFDCNDEYSYTLFPGATAPSGEVYQQLACNYSFDVQIVNEFAVCNGGKKVLVKLSYFDWCNPERSLEHCAYVLLKWYDNEAPTFTDIRKKQDEPRTVSTGPMDCTAAFFIDRQGFKDYFGLEIKDNCDPNPTVSVTKMWRWGLKYVYGIPVTTEEEWHEETYQVMVMNGRPLVLGLAPGKYWFEIESFDHCYNKQCYDLEFYVVDKIAPVMKCDDQLNITLSNSQGAPYGQGYPAVGTGIYGYARVLAKDVDEGSWDNCGMDRIKIRRSYDATCQADFIAKGYDWHNNGKIEAGKDGIDENRDGSLSANEKFESVTRNGVATVMTPWLDYAEFFCCDLGKKVIVELGGWDKSGNFNYCWSEQLIEDKVLPTYILPWPVTIKCTDRAYVEGLLAAAGNADGWDVTGTEYKTFVEKVLTDKGGVQNVLVTMSGNDCRNTVVKAKVTTDLHCEAGTVTVTYSYTKTTSKGTVTNTIGSVAITVQPVHEYNIMFPADLEGDCVNIRDTANVIDGGELSCDVLAVNVSDKRYNGATLNGAPIAECYKIFRTFTVINWCQYDERCGEPMQWAVVVPRDPNSNGTNWNDGGGVNVLVRDANMDKTEEIYYEDEDGNVAYPADAVNWANKGGKTVSSDDKVPTGLPAACEYASYGNNGSERFAWMFTQYIFVHDKVRPVVKDPAAFTFYQNKNNCNTTVSIEFSAEDLCSVNTEVQQVPAVAGNLAIERVRFNGGELPSWLTVAPAHKLNGDDKGTNSWVVSGTGTSAQAPIGDHKLTVIVRDDCGNLSLAKDIPFSIKDTNGIAPICYHGLSTDLMKNPDNGKGEMVIWATDFKASDVQDCNAKTVGTKENIPDAQYYVVKDVDGDGAWTAADGLNDKGVPTSPATSVTFDCDDLDGDTIATVMVRLYTKDALGNWAWCETYAVITDARKVCGGGPSAAAAAIAGAIATESAINVEGVEVNLSGDASMSYMTNANGQFNFNGLNKGYDYTVTPQLDKNYLNGVSTFDLVLITKHILGVQPLNSPYKLIAADVNNSKSVTTLDLIQLRKLILNIDNKFGNNTSWRFVDASYSFPNPANPWSVQFPEVANLNDLGADARANFVAVKIGDVNGNAVATSQVRTAGEFGLNVADQALKAGNEYRVEVAGDLKSIEGLQFSMSYDVNAIELVDVEYGVAKEENFGIFAKEGVITASWNGDANSNTFATLVFRATADANLSEVLNLNSRYTAAEAYRNNDQLSVALNFAGAQAEAAGFELKQNTPNPFAGETVIGFNLPVAGEATLTIQDVTGRTLRVVRGQFAQGYNQVTLKATDLNATGVLTYTLEAAEFTATKKMIIVE